MRELKCKINVVENTELIQGSALWLADRLNDPNTSIKIGVSTTGYLCAWLKLLLPGEDKARSECLVCCCPNYRGKWRIDTWPLEESYFDFSYENAFGIHLSKGAQKLLKQLALKARSILKYRMNKSDLIDRAQLSPAIRSLMRSAL